MNVYVDSSVVLRVVFRAPGRLSTWNRINAAWTSEVARVECFRTVDRLRLGGTIDDAEVARLRVAVDEIFEAVDLVPVDRRILRRAAEPMPTALRTLDAIHVASALALRGQTASLQLATHDGEMATAARALGFRVIG